MCVAVLFATTARAQENKKPVEVRIGVVTDLTGRFAYWSKQSVIGAQIAEEELRPEGIALKTIFEDTGGDTKKAVSAAQKLILMDKVDAIYSESSPLAAAASPVAKTQKKLFLYEAAAVSILELNPHALKSYLDVEKGCRDIARYWRTLGVKKLGVLRATLEFGELCKRGAISVYPEYAEAVYNSGEDVRTQLITLKSKGVEAILNLSFEPDMLNMFKALEEMRFTPRIGVNFDSLTQKLRTQFAPLMPQVVCYSSAPIPDEFVKKVQAHDPSNSLTTLEAAALINLHLRQIARAARQCTSRSLECMMDHILKSSPDPLMGFQRWKGRSADLSQTLTIFKDGKPQQIAPPLN